MSRDTYDCLLGHLEHHSVKQALIDMCDREDARTIRNRLNKTSSREICKALARVLAER